jgi:ABC-type cobalamin/Fe3+-siderophores transport system ATPase subunit
MRIPSFRVQQDRSIRLAECTAVPRLMVIAGPNGAGKSTLLNNIRLTSGQGQVLYVGPHRTARRQSVQWRHLLSQQISLEALLSSQSMPGYEGVAISSSSRDPWGYDDAASYLKHGLCQIEVERKDAIAARYDREHEIPKDALPDPWAPLKELTSNLLPHLSFERIDASNRDAMRVLWRAHAKDTIVDLDDLSSGEKSIIQIFYPLVEARIKEILRQIQHAETTVGQPEMCVLIDEPELHLHPNLQVKVFDYLRLLTAGNRIQVIIATHSPTIVEYASFEELFLLRPIETVSEGDNQLLQVASDETRLQFLREVFGTTSNLTALQPVVVVEGIDQTDTSRTVSDRKLYRALHPGFDRVTLIAGGGKADCIRLCGILEKALGQIAKKVRAVALLDRDLATAEPPQGTVYLPVSMIENLLVDPVALWEAVQSVVEKTGFKTIDDVGKAIDAILNSMTREEIDRRVVRAVGRSVYQPRAPIAELPGKAEAFIEKLRETTSPERIKELLHTAEKQVQSLEATSQRREYFDGKEILRRFAILYLHKSGMSEVIFRYEAARHARARQHVLQFFDSFFATSLPEAGAPIVKTSTK